MAVTVVLADELATILEKMCKAGVRHPVDLTKTLLLGSVQGSFSMGADGLTATVRLESTGAHSWPYESDPTKIFDDRELG
jgi:hypothetical protein